MANDPENDAVKPDPALDSLESRIATARAAEDVRLAQDHASYPQAAGLGVSVVSTLLGYPLGGIVVGWLLDGLFGTRPWIMIGLMFLAFVGALMQVGRINKNRQDRT